MYRFEENPIHLLKKYPKFARLWLASAISSFGDRFNDLAIPIYVFMLTDSALHLGIAFAVQTATSLLIGFFAGALVDRLPRKAVMVGADVFRLVIFVFVAFTTIMTAPLAFKLGVIYFLAFLSSAADTFYRPAKGALLPQLVDQKDILAVNSLDQGTRTIAMVLGFAAAGFTLEALGVFAAFMFNAATFLVSGIMLWSIAHKEEAPEDKRGVTIVSDVLSGFSYTFKKPILKKLISVNTLAAIGMGGLTPLILLLSHRILGSGDYGLAILEMLFSVGLALALFYVGARLKDMSRGVLMSRSWFAFGLTNLFAFGIPTLLVMSGVSNIAVLLAIAALLYGLVGASNSGIIVGVNTIIQENSEQAFMARVFANYNVLTSVVFGIGQALAGLADVVGLIPLAIFWSVWMIIFGIIAMSLSWDEAPKTPTIIVD